MRYAPRIFSVVLLLLLFLPLPANSRTKDQGQPQMVWITYAQGQVKFSPGRDGEARLDKTWIEANPGQVLEEGYTLVTEDGRVEIEFEDGSVAYLADHSALQFNSLWTTEKGTVTGLALLTGKATVAHQPPDDPHAVNLFSVATPVSDTRMIRQRTTITFQSMVDGALVEALEGSPMVEQSSAFGVLRQGESKVYVKGRPPVLRPTREKTADEKDWDQWVAGRLATHRALIAEGLQESGMAEPIPGLAGMVENGRFYDCPPDGRCWQANDSPPLAYLEPQPMLSALSSQETQAARASSQHAPANGQGTVFVNQTMMTRCPIEAWRVAASQQANAQSGPLQYGTCMAGTWNPSQWDPNDPCWRRDPATNKVHYRSECDAYNTWVAGPRHRHECRFVKGHGHGRTVAVAPRQALDQKGHLTLNAKTPILMLTAEKGQLKAGVEPPSKTVYAVADFPRGMEHELVANTPRVSQPVIEAKTAAAILPKEMLSPKQAAAMKNVSAIHFDYKSGNFVGKTGQGVGSHSVVVAHTGGTGGIGTASHGSSGGGGGGSHGGGSSSGSGGHSGGSSGGASSAGGGGHR
jgi:FecR-like protein